MSRIPWRAVAAASAAVLSISAAEAALIVDTGPGQPGIALGLNSLGASYQHLGATFNVAQASSITSVEGWIGGTGGLVFELHQGATPNGALLFSTFVNVTSGFDNWRGATGLDWDVQAGDYTLAVIAQAGFNGQMQTGAPNPVAFNWFANPLAPNWSTTTFSVGWRVGADATTVPEPGSLALAALALVAAGAIRKRQA